VQYSLSFSVQLDDLCSVFLGSCQHLITCSFDMFNVCCWTDNQTKIKADPWFQAVAQQLYRGRSEMFTGDLVIGRVHLPRTDTLNSLPLFSYSCANTPSLRLSSVMLANMRKPATRYSNPAPSVPVAPSLHSHTVLLIFHLFHSVNQPDRFSLSLSFLPSPQLSLTLCPYRQPPLLYFPCLFLTVSVSLSQ